ncbi:super-infection exclusion protein B [Roseovarius bejariae]|nr:super-infection exclusion protein B [Roseovarius bejariae]
MPSLKDFVAAMQAGWFPALAALVGCSIIIAGDFYDLPYLSATPDIVLTAAVVTSVFSFSILTANIAYVPVKVWAILKKRKAQKARRERLIRNVEEAPEEERAILAYLVSSRRQAFAAEFNDQRLAPLESKGLVIKLSGTHSALQWPYMVQQTVWEYLLEHQDHFYMEIPEGTGDPFNWRRSRW